MTTHDALNKISRGFTLQDTETGYAFYKVIEGQHVQHRCPLNIARALIRRGHQPVRVPRAWETYGSVGR